jgi:hypothetical protein
LKKLEGGNLFLMKLPTRLYFIWKIWCRGRQPFD